MWSVIRGIIKGLNFLVGWVYPIEGKNWNFLVCRGFSPFSSLAKWLILASLAKWLSVRLRTKWFWVWIQLQSILLKVCFLDENFRKILETLWKSLFFLWELHAGSQPRRPTCDWCNVLPCVLSYMSFIKLFSTFKFFCCFFYQSTHALTLL